MPSRHPDVIVVGLGAMGSATVYQLARRGVRVLGLDRYSPPHPLGSTHGDTRITRQAIGEGLAYVPLALRSHDLWREVEAETGADVMTTNGCLILGRSGSGFGFHGRADFLADTIAAAEAYGIAHEVLDGAEVGRRFPQFAVDGDEVGYLEPGGGFLRPEAGVAANLALAERSGADLRYGERVVDVSPGPDGVTVRTTHGEHAAGEVVVSAGPWVGSLVGDALARRFVVSRQVMHWFASREPLAAVTPSAMPVYIWAVSRDRAFYGFPAIDGPHGGMKVAAELDEPAVDPDSVASEVPLHESLALYDTVVGARLPALERRRVKAVTCLYTMTADGDFVIDRHPDTDRVLIVSPCSGHGFKHSAAIGEAVAELVTEGGTTIDLGAFRLTRFTT